MKLRGLSSVCAAALLGAGLSSPAFAQIDEIIVTATKREESLQEVPIAVSAFNAQALERVGVQTIRDLPNLTPSFNMNSSNTETGGTTLRIRGIGTTGNNIGLESAVGIFLDGVFLSRPGIALGDLVDLEQVELLRGPQGTLYGRNTSAGAIAIRTRKPDTEQWDAWGNATYGNFNAPSVQAGGNVPLIQDTLAIRLSGAWRQRDGFVESVFPGDSTRAIDEPGIVAGPESNDRDRFFLRGQALWEMTEDMSFRLIGDYGETDEHCCDAVILNDETLTVQTGQFTTAGLANDGGVLVSGADAVKNRKTNSEEFSESVKQWGISGEFNWDVGPGTLTYLGSYRHFEADGGQHADFVTTDVFNNGYAGIAGRDPLNQSVESDGINTQSHEIRYGADAFGGRLQYLVGGYYIDEHIDGVGEVELGADYFEYITGAAFNPAAFGLLPGIWAARGITTEYEGAFAQNRVTQDATSWSIFTHNTVELWQDKLDFVFGLRWVDDSKDGKFEQVAANNPICDNGGLVAGLPNERVPGAVIGDGIGIAGTALDGGFTCFVFARGIGAEGNGSVAPREFDESFSDQELVYTAKLVGKFTDDITAYFSYTHGYKTGGFNLDASAALPTSPNLAVSFDPDVNRANVAALNAADPAGLNTTPDGFGPNGSPQFASETNDVWELGIKSDLFNDTLRANVTLFHSKLDNFQVLEFTGTNFVTFNVPKAKSVGVETEFLANVAEGWNIGLNVTYADARYPEDCATPGVDADAVISLCGNRLTNSALWSGVLNSSYERDIGSEFAMFLNAAWRMESGRRTSTQPFEPGLVSGTTGLASPGYNAANVGDIQEGNGKLNLRLGFGHVEGLWAVELWGDNVFDKQTRNVTFNIPLRGTNTIGPNFNSRGAFLEAPRTFGVTLRTRWN